MLTLNQDTRIPLENSGEEVETYPSFTVYIPKLEGSLTSAVFSIQADTKRVSFELLLGDNSFKGDFILGSGLNSMTYNNKDISIICGITALESKDDSDSSTHMYTLHNLDICDYNTTGDSQDDLYDIDLDLPVDFGLGLFD